MSAFVMPTMGLLAKSRKGSNEHLFILVLKRVIIDETAVRNFL
jgi:hypothetical protein